MTGAEPDGENPSSAPGDPDAATLPRILALFTQIGLTSFGGGLSAWIYREVVGRRRWLTEDEFLGGLALSQILPGPNVINLSIYIGQRLRGSVGSLIAVTALLLPPMFVVVVLAAIFHRFSDLAWLHDMLEGIAAAAIGLTFSVAYRAAQHAASHSRVAPLFTLAVFAAIGLLDFPMIPVVLCLAPLAVFVAMRKRRP